MPAELHQAREALREQVRCADAEGLRHALAHLERVLEETFDPDDPRGPLGAALGKVL
jgi:hypothetical protein